MTGTVGRRGLLGGLAAGGALAATGGLHGVASAGPIPSTVDVIVVGGGLSGLVAARDIAARGRSVVVLEARDRVGGRILNHTLADGSVVESGAAFVGPTQDHILALAAELGVPTFKQHVDGNNIYRADGHNTPYTGSIPPDPWLLPDAGILQAKVDAMAREVPVDAPWLAPKAEEWDSTTVHDFLASNSLNPGVLNLLMSYIHPSFGIDAREISLLHLIWFIATAGNEDNPGTFQRSSGTEDGAQDSRFVGGSQLIPLRLAEQLGDAVVLNAPVRRIDQTENQVRATTDHGVVTGAQLVMAVPPPLATAIDWYPDLPAPHRQLLQRHEMGTLMKCDAIYDTPFWREDGLSGMSIQDEGAVRVSFDNSPPDAEVGVLLAFVGGSVWRDWAMRSESERRDAVLHGFANAVGPRALQPIDYVEHDWTRERWTLGSPVATPGPGTTTAFGRHIREPFGRVHWAGTETSTYWAGFMDGAVRAGHRVAREVVA